MRNLASHRRSGVHEEHRGVLRASRALSTTRNVRAKEQQSLAGRSGEVVKHRGRYARRWESSRKSCLERFVDELIIRKLVKRADVFSSLARPSPEKRINQKNEYHPSLTLISIFDYLTLPIAEI